MQASLHRRAGTSRGGCSWRFRARGGCTAWPDQTRPEQTSTGEVDEEADRGPDGGHGRDAALPGHPPDHHTRSVIFIAIGPASGSCYFARFPLVLSDDGGSHAYPDLSAIANSSKAK